MVNMALLFVGISLAVLLLLFVAARWLIPKVFEEESEDEDHGHPS